MAANVAMLPETAQQKKYCVHARGLLNANPFPD
jgi:hypothetical protein